MIGCVASQYIGETTTQIKKNLSMAGIAENTNLEFDDDLTCIFNDDNVEKIIPHICIMNEEGPKGESQDQNSEDDVFLKKIECNMLTKWIVDKF